MATEAPERSKALHNFSLPCSWGNTKLLRCMKPSSLSDPHPDSDSINLRFKKSDDGIDAVREKLMSDLRVAADKMKVSIIKTGVDVHSSPAVVDRPWNLRTRRAAACKSPNQEQKGSNLKTSLHEHEHRMNSPPKSTRLRGSATAEKKFSITLTKEEIEEDFFNISGVKPARRPKKRPRTLQKQLDLLFPGSWLSEVTLDTYKVTEIPDSGKG